MKHKSESTVIPGLHVSAEPGIQKDFLAVFLDSGFRLRGPGMT